MAAFALVWLGQVVSLFGTAMTRFALTIWAWDITGEATALSLVAFFSFAPEVLLSPLAGALVDRWNRKLVMMISDLAAGLATLVVLILYLTGNLQVWHLWVAGAFTGSFAAFQFPAYSAAISTMIPKEQYTRASGMLSLAESGSGILAPLAAGALIGFFGLGAGFSGITLIMLIDVLTFVFAIGALFAVHVPQPPRTEAGREGRGSLWRESIYGFRYIAARPSLLSLQLVFFGGNFLTSLAFVLAAPMILARTENNTALLGAVNSVGALGGVVGGVLISAWGGPKRRVLGVLLGWTWVGLFQIIFGFGQFWWFVGLFLMEISVPTLDGSNQAIWQAKVAPDVQGRVFSARRLIAQSTVPIASLMAGPLADRVFEPAMMPDGYLAQVFGSLVGTGPGSGMALIFVFGGLLTALVGLIPFAVPLVRDAEQLLPDHDLSPAPAD